ncbi:unnamed protein product [Heterotrigona itama]|uniref:EF-hand domain-containing protein n=1 Tax=Heterotrigona itama TaxID=395501 RepID=A0A6V7HE46_9HYME|nr:unnamed protein product [Heterotrigona itama]
MPAEQAVDMLNDTLAEIVFRTKNMPRFKRLARTTHFNLREVEALSIIHRKCVKTLGPISRLIFRDIFHAGLDFTKNIRHLLVDKMFSVIDKRNALQVYDSMRTHKLKKEHIFPMMRGCLIKLQNDENPDEAVKDLIDLLIKKLDVDRDGVISEEDFKTAVKERNQLLLECMGPIFPSRDARHVFLSTFTDRVGRY